MLPLPEPNLGPLLNCHARWNTRWNTKSAFPLPTPHSNSGFFLHWKKPGKSLLVCFRRSSWLRCLFVTVFHFEEAFPFHKGNPWLFWENSSEGYGGNTLESSDSLLSIFWFKTAHLKLILSDFLICNNSKFIKILSTYVSLQKWSYNDHILATCAQNVLSLELTLLLIHILCSVTLETIWSTFYRMCSEEELW